MLNEDPVFVFRNAAKYKSLTAEIGQDEAVLTSFGLSVGRLLTAASVGGELPIIDPAQLRATILGTWQFVTLESLLNVCWAFGVPVAYLRVFPLDAKRMHAMSVRVGDRFAILLGRDTTYPAALAFTLAHELGHVALGHFGDQSAVVDYGDPASDVVGVDDEEDAATRFALLLLTGDGQFEVEADRDNFNAAQLADAAIRASETTRIEPSMLALALGHATGRWTQAFAAMKLMGTAEPLLIDRVNAICRSQLNWGALGSDDADYLARLIRAHA